LEMAIATWPAGIRPVVHYSEPRDAKTPRAHADVVSNVPDLYDHVCDVMVEAKHKELALLGNRKICDALEIYKPMV